MTAVATIRPMTPADRQFVRSGWSASYRESYDLPLIPMRDFSKYMHPIIDSYLDHPKVQTLVAAGELGVLFGFVSADPTPYAIERQRILRSDDPAAPKTVRVRIDLAGYVFYLYVAGPFRRRRIARQLLTAAGIDPAQPFGFAASTRWNRTLRRKIPFAEYDTLRARYLSMETT